MLKIGLIISFISLFIFCSKLFGDESNHSHQSETVQLPFKFYSLEDWETIKSFGEGPDFLEYTYIPKVSSSYREEEFNFVGDFWVLIFQDIHQIVQPGSKVGCRWNKNTNLVIEVIGVVAKDGRTTFSNGIALLLNGKTIYEAFENLLEAEEFFQRTEYAGPNAPNYLFDITKSPRLNDLPILQEREWFYIPAGKVQQK